MDTACKIRPVSLILSFKKGEKEMALFSDLFIYLCVLVYTYHNAPVE